MWNRESAMDSITYKTGEMTKNQFISSGKIDMGDNLCTIASLKK